MRLRGRPVDLSRPQVVGILNLTPDSFSDGGLLGDVDAVVDHARRLADEGADVLDLGAESTRPGAHPVSEAQERARLLPALERVVAAVALPVAVDTRRAAVADAALAAGAAMINDVSGFGDPAMAVTVARHGAAWVLMHMPHAVGAMAWTSASAAMPSDLEAGIARVGDDLHEAVERAVAGGVARTQLAIDPGIGFGKTLAQNLALLHNPPAIAKLGLPIYVGPSRKSFIAAASGRRYAQSPLQREAGTAAAVTAAVLSGASFVRVHDVAAMRQAVDVAHALRLAGGRRG